MAKFRKKPVVIDAELFQGDYFAKDPPGLCRCNAMTPHCHTLEGRLCVSTGDWIIKGVKGEFYPCKPDIFAQTYEPVDDTGQE